MTTGHEAELAKLTAAMRRAQEARLRAIAAEEAELRGELARLEDLARQSRHLPADELEGLRMVGGDLLWQAFLGRGSADLNVKLARVLARKARSQRDLRRAFGRSLAAETIEDHARSRRLESRRRKAQEEDQALGLLKAASAARRASDDAP